MQRQTLMRIMLVLSLAFVAVSSARAAEYRVAYSFDAETPPGNIAVSNEGRIFISNHFFFEPQYIIKEVLPDGSAVPYPNSAFSKALNPVLGVIVDQKGILWMLETASGKDRAGRLIGWDTVKNSLYKMIYIAPPVIPENSFLNDLAVDRKHEAIYITDTAGGSNSALIVVDLLTGETRRVLEGSRFTQPEPIDMVIDGKTVTLGDGPARIGVNPITIDPHNQWVYFGAMNGTALYRVETADLLNPRLSEEQLQKRVEFYAKKPISDGIAIDDDDNVYISDITANAVGVIDAKRNYRVLFKDNEKVSWADGFATGAEYTMYVTVNKLHKSPPLNGGKDESQGRYYILEFDALGATTIGR